MIELSENASDEEILQAIRQWAGLLAAGDYDAAFSLTLHGPEDPWTPELMRTVVSNYGSIDPRPDGRAFRVTPLETASGGPTPRHEITRFAPCEGLVGSAWFDLPLDGEWSDLTATFELRKVDQHLVLLLEDIHVM